MNIKILVATHKKYRMPSDEMYFPIHVGKAGKNLELGYVGDNTGDHISEKNSTFCELTGIYWAYKNLDAEYIGLTHYRRHFTRYNKGRDKFGNILSQNQLESLLRETSIILPKKRHYFIETNYSHYIHAHHKEGIDLLGEIIRKKHPSYLASYDNFMKRTSAHMFNMFIMRKDYFDAFCKWMFPILFEIEKRLDITDYSTYEKRVFGFLAERMLDIWIDANHLSYKELPIMFMESQNWLAKGFAFLKRKFVPTYKI
ncbi:MAG: hypothetical protein PWP24_692 [Clostridiales bacterium]|nr:hypothetical protein [Clostridiales bacterium]